MSMPSKIRVARAVMSDRGWSDMLLRLVVFAVTRT
jgi:hypothetical protein